jgi:hypothetical protein
MLKIRYSYGQVGNNKIMKGDVEVRFPYVGSIGTIGGYNYGDLGSPIIAVCQVKEASVITPVYILPNMRLII